MIYPPMRPQIEVQRLHDLLMGVLSDRRLTEEVIDDEMIGPLRMAADCLCWILHHDVDVHPDSHAANFASCIRFLREEVERVGYTWVEPPGSEYIVEE